MAYAKSELKSSASNATHLALCMLTAGLRNSPKCDVCILRFLLWPSRFISRNRTTNCAVCIPSPTSQFLDTTILCWYSSCLVAFAYRTRQQQYSWSQLARFLQYRQNLAIVVLCSRSNNCPHSTSSDYNVTVHLTFFEKGYVLNVHYLKTLSGIMLAFCKQQ